MPTPLWAPWRMDYILGTTKAPGCFLCDYPKAGASTFRENLVVVVQPHAFVCLNRYPFTPSHLLVAPRRHVASVEDLDEVEYAATMSLFRDCVVRLKRAVRCEGINAGFNLGKVAGAGVADHLHGHLVPRWAGDVNFMPVLADVRVMPEHLDEAWQRLIPAFADLPGEHPA
ncbi:MAG: HIT domain-containing protein [Labilithrix sp.]|nr:HIT domain-containing protein [Labilithrix sp.]